jgi:hypothetical protein
MVNDAVTSPNDAVSSPNNNLLATGNAGEMSQTHAKAGGRAAGRSP